MIRSNPTAIGLRASDVKHLQAELDKRKATSTTTTSAPAQAQSTTSGGTTMQGAHNAVEAAKLNKKQQTTAERIGL